MSVQGITDWGINPLALPICYGRYENSIAKHFKTIQSQTGKKFDYMYKCQGEAFTLRMNAIANEFQEVCSQFNADDMVMSVHNFMSWGVFFWSEHFYLE